MDALIRIFLMVAVIVPLSEQRSYSFSSTKASYLHFSPLSWLSPDSSSQYLSFRFKTHSSDGLLAFIEDGSVTVKLTDGHIDVSTSSATSLFQDNQKLADNKWHTIVLIKDSAAKTVKLNLDGRGLVVAASGVSYTAGKNTVYVGGLDNDTHTEVKLTAGYNGCIDSLQFAGQDNNRNEPTSWEEPTPTKQSEELEACQDRCLDNNPCQNGGQCRSSIDRVTCDCSQTLYEGPDCSVQEASIISLNGVQCLTFDGGKASSTAVHTTTDLSDKIALQFKTHFSEGILLVVDSKGESSVDEATGPSATISVFIARGKYLHLAVNTADPSQHEVLTFDGAEIVDGKWHSLVLQLEPTQIRVKLDNNEQRTSATGGKKFKVFQSVVSIGGIRAEHPFAGAGFNNLGLSFDASNSFFVGCLRRIYYGSTNILEESMRPEQEASALHIRYSAVNSSSSQVSSLSTVVQTECQAPALQDLSITFPSDETSAVIPQDSLQPIDIKLTFRLPEADSSSPAAGKTVTLLSAVVDTRFGAGDFKILLSNGLDLVFNYPDQNGNQQQFRTAQPIGGVLSDGEWHSMHLIWPSQDYTRTRRQDVTEGNSSATAEGNPTDLTLTPAAEENDLLDVVGVTTSHLAENVTLASTESVTLLVAVVEADRAGNDDDAVDRIRIQTPPNQDPNSVYALPSGVDQRSTLTLEVDGKSVLLYPGASSVMLKGPLTLGKRDDESGFTGCVRDIQDHGIVVDARAVLAKSDDSGVTLGQCAQTNQSCQSNNPCEHGAKCQTGISDLTCDCSDTGYTGRTCHIPLHSETCTDLFLAGERRSGVHLIDLDGSGLMSPLYVYCNMSQEAQGVTTVTHNFQKAVLGNAKMGGVKYEVHYRQFDKAALRKLVEISKQCRQFISYKCRNAPLKLGTHTWFRSISETGNITSFGSNNPGKCNCAVGGSVCGLGARKDIACNCDADDSTDRIDDGYFSGKDFVGITNMTFINRPIGGSGVVTLGPLECSGKEWIERTVSFMSHAGSLSLPTLASNEDITFFFKTALKSAVLLYQPSVDGSSSFRISIVNATTAALYISLNGAIREVKVTSDKVLNNGAWHSVKVQFGANELKFTVDLNHKYISWAASDRIGQYKGQLHVGGYPQSPEIAQAEPGLIGCIKGFFRGSQSVDVEASIETSGSKEIRRGCQTSCTPNPCRNGAECFDKFGDYECICTNPLAQSGKNCENDINDKAVTFETSNSSYILVKTLNQDVFSQDILFSFRSHAPSGVLLYAHDNLHNFIQLHLDGGQEIVFTFNSADKIHQLSVKDDAFSNGRWHQIHVQRQANQTTLTVDYLHTQTVELLEGLLPLTVYSGRPFGARSGESVLPGRPSYAIMPFKNLYIGGLATPQIRSSIPGFHGCVRGLKIGQQLFQLLNEPDSDIAPGVVEGCNAVCDTASPCQHLGQCINNWGNISNPTECDCAGTSYVGETCSEDIGGNMDGSSQLIVEYKPGHVGSRSLDLSHKVNFALAFSTSVLPEQDAGLLFVQTYQKLAELIIGLTAKGEISVKLLTEETTSVGVVIEGNYADGQRHYVSVQTSADNLVVQVDKKRKEAAISLFPTFVHFTTIGGITVPVKRQTELASYSNYSGCISNIRIEVPDQPKFRPLEPLKTGLRKELPPFTAMRFTGTDLTETQCAVPPVPTVLTPGSGDGELMGTNLTFPNWDIAPAVALEYTVDTPRPDPQVPLQRNTGIIVGVICGIFLLAILIGVLVYIRRLKRNKKNNYSPPQINHEPTAHDPLLMRNEPVLEREETAPLSHREKIKPLSRPYDRPVTNYIDETIIPPNQRARELEKHLDGSNGSSVHQDQRQT